VFIRGTILKIGNISCNNNSNMKNSGISFASNYDIHTHTGHWWTDSAQKYDGAVEVSPGNYAVLRDYTSVDTLEIANKNITNFSDKIDKMFVSNLDCMVRNHPDILKSTVTSNGTPFLQDEIKGNLALLDIYKNKNDYVLYATCQPGYGSAKNIEKIIKAAPDRFKGLKFHPKQLNLRADDFKYDEYMKLAEKRNLPCLFHSQVNIDHSGGIGRVVANPELQDVSDPEFIYNLGKRYPSVPVIMGHAGAGGQPAHQKAIDILLKSINEKDANLYCDISWVDFENGLPAKEPKTIIGLIKKLQDKNALDRIMFGTDIPLGCYGADSERLGITGAQAYKTTVENLKNSIRKNFGKDADSIINKIFYENAQKLFFQKVPTTVKTTAKKIYTAAGIIAAAMFITGAGWGISKMNNKNPHCRKSGIGIKRRS